MPVNHSDTSRSWVSLSSCMWKVGNAFLQTCYAVTCHVSWWKHVLVFGCWHMKGELAKTQLGRNSLKSKWFCLLWKKQNLVEVEYLKPGEPNCPVWCVGQRDSRPIGRVLALPVVPMFDSTERNGAVRTLQLDLERRANQRNICLHLYIFNIVTQRDHYYFIRI